MKKEWSKMTPTEKKLMVLLCIYVAIALVFVALDLSGMWKNKVYKYMTVVFCLGEGVVEWKKNRKMALLDLVLAVVFLF